MSLAVVIIASEKRVHTTFSACLDSVMVQEPDEILVVADFQVDVPGVTAFHVEPITRTTIDALVKRDVGFVGSTADTICYLCEDHRLHPGFVFAFRALWEQREWDMLCPSRYCMRDGERVALNMGQDQGYIGGHAGLYRRDTLKQLPWGAGPHHRNWDLLHTHALVAKGAVLAYAGSELAVEDIEGGKPWL